ncbi:RNA polymerase sigma-70 factor [Pedobacter sp. ASV1-7]|uniref:RNA polymerase sigma factor n=1 Tax=Pedobacter sp. ASV1-7 TaxID=3145237 RepID=UPI0032E8CFD3
MSGRYDKYSDQELVALIKLGDEQSFAEVFNRYKVLLFNFSYKKLNNKDVAKDVVQDLFIKLWNNRDEFELKTSLNSYMYRSVLNGVLNIVKHDLIKEEYVNSLQHMIDQSTEESDHKIREKDIENLIEMEIAALPQQMREVFIMRRKEYLSNKEVAEKLNISEQTVETHMKRALKVLRKRLGKLSYFLSVI